MQNLFCIFEPTTNILVQPKSRRDLQPSQQLAGDAKAVRRSLGVGGLGAIISYGWQASCFFIENFACRNCIYSEPSFLVRGENPRDDIMYLR